MNTTTANQSSMTTEEILDLQNSAYQNYQHTSSSKASSDNWMRNVLLAEQVLQLRKSNQYLQSISTSLANLAVLTQVR